MQGMWGLGDLRAQQISTPMQGVRRFQCLPTLENKKSMSRVWRGQRVPSQQVTPQMQGVRRGRYLHTWH